MKIPLQITMRHMEQSDALEARIQELVGTLERYHPRVTSCRVVVDETGRHQRQGAEWTVSVDVRLPGHAEAVSTRRRAQDVYVALRNAFEAMTRQLAGTTRNDSRTRRRGSGAAVESPEAAVAAESPVDEMDEGGDADALLNEGRRSASKMDIERPANADVPTRRGSAP